MGFFSELASRFGDLFTAPLQHPEMVWAVTPLLVTLVLMTLYFGRYTGEELGWNTAVGNNLVLVFVSIDLLRYIYTNPHVENIVMMGGIPVPTKTLAALVVIFEAFSIAFADFFHFIPKQVAFLISSPVPVNVTAYVAMVIVYSDIPFDATTLIAAIILFGLILGMVTLTKRMMRGSLTSDVVKK